MQLKLKKPIVFLDLETTGTNIATDRIVEISLIKILPDGGEDVMTRRINPEMPIPPAVTAIHKISDDDVKDCPTFKQLAHKFAQFIEGADLAGYNSNRFDIPLLAEEFIRAGVQVNLRKRLHVDVQTIFHKMEQRDLSTACMFYCKRPMANAHSAEADARATYEVLKAQLDHYPQSLKNDVGFLAEFTTHTKNVDFAGRMIYDEQGREVFNFGKYKGRIVEEVFNEAPSYFDWIMENDFPLDTKHALMEIQARLILKNKR
jgi:DNA polymerase-3 subunit epsilon